MKIEIKNNKVQYIGNSYYICLPMIWINTLKIKKGDKLDITILNDGKLMVMGK